MSEKIVLLVKKDSSGSLSLKTDNAINLQTFDSKNYPPSSSTQATSIAHCTLASEDSKALILPGSPIEEDFYQITDEAPRTLPKNNSLQISGTSPYQKQISSSSLFSSDTYLTKSLDTPVCNSRDAKRSFLSKWRNGGGEMSAKHSGTFANKSFNGVTPASASIVLRPSKRQGILSFLCCGFPDNFNLLDTNDATVHSKKITKITVVRPTTSSRPEQSSNKNTSGTKNRAHEALFSEKDVLQQESKQSKTKDPSPEICENLEKNFSPGPANGRENQSIEIAPKSTVSDEELLNATRSKSASPSLIIHSNSSLHSDEGSPMIASQSETKTKDSSNLPGSDSTTFDKSEAQSSVSQKMFPPHEIPLDLPVHVITNSSEPIDGNVVLQSEQEKPPLLPPIAPHFKGKKCLVLDLDETLVHSSFKVLHQADFTIPVEIEGQFHNVYVIKRPGVDEFMKRVGELYEVVVFTASVSKYGDPLLDQLDIHHVVHHRLFRESCHNHGGNYVKDLSKVGRDLRETIIIDNSPSSYIFHPQHAVPISSWFSDVHDNELLDLIPVLEDLAGSQVRDVSLVLDVAL